MTTTEVCPLCSEEVELEEELKVQTCPECGKPILPCSLCDPDTTDCGHCPLIEERNIAWDWTRELPTEPGLYWFYSYRYGRVSIGNIAQPEMLLMEAMKISNGMGYHANGQFVFESEYEDAWFQKAIIPELPTMERMDFYTGLCGERHEKLMDSFYVVCTVFEYKDGLVVTRAGKLDEKEHMARDDWESFVRMIAENEKEAKKLYYDAFDQWRYHNNHGHRKDDIVLLPRDERPE